LTVADSNGEHARTVETGIAATKTIDAVCWAPDGRSIYLAVSDAGDNTRARESQLWRVPMDGGAPHDTGLSGTSIGRIDLNRNGSRLAYSAGQLARYELWALDHLDTTWKITAK
jgi:hypothetical protein